MPTYKTLHHTADSPAYTKSVSQQMEGFLWKLLLLAAMMYLVWSENVRIQIGLFSLEKSELNQQARSSGHALLGLLGMDSGLDPAVFKQVDASAARAVLSPEMARQLGASPLEIAAGRRQCEKFVQQFKAIAVAEMRRSGVPASVLLAQSLLVSNAGERPLCKSSNNYFLSPCTDADCGLEHCVVGKNGPKADVFPHPWSSFSAQCAFWTAIEPLGNLSRRENRDYRIWADSLEKELYPERRCCSLILCRLIRQLQLDKYDRW